MRRLLAHADMRLLLVGEATSMFGDRAMMLVFAIWVKSLTGSNSLAGLTIFAINLPAVAGPLAGLLVDRVRRRPLMIAVDLAMAVTMLGSYFVHGPGQVWLLFTLAFLYGAAYAVFSPAQSALLTVMLPADLLGAANGAFQSVREGLRLVAPVAGAAVFAAFGGPVVATLDAATFLVSAACLGALRTREPTPPRMEKHLLTELAMGARHVAVTLPLRQVVIAFAATFLVVGFAETVIFAVIERGLHMPPAFLGVLSSAQGIGAIAGGLAAGPGLRRFGDLRVGATGLLLAAAGSAVQILPVTVTVLAAMVMIGFGISWISVSFGTAIQLRTPAHLQGRAYSAGDAMITLPHTLSIALGAVLAAVVDYRVLLAVMAVVLAGAGAYLLTRRFSPPLPSE